MNTKPKMALWAFSLCAILLASGNVLGQQEITVDTSPITEALQPGDAFQFDITITNDGDAPLTWSAALEDIYGRKRGVSFAKADFANWILPANQDRISSNLWIARDDNKSIFNAKSETSSDNNSPVGTEWALGSYNDATTFDTFKNMHGSDPQSLIGNTATLHDIMEGVYYELDFTAWTGGNDGGGFAYTRYEMTDFISFQGLVTDPIAAGASATITIVLNADDLDSDTFTSNLIITSNDADEGELTIPISLEVLEPATFELSATSFSQTVTTGDEPVTQTLTISNNGSSVLEWDTNETFGRPSEMSGVTLSTFSDQVVDVQEVTITFADGGNNEGTYEWPLTFFSNDPLNPTEVVTISLEILGLATIATDDPPSFATTFVGSTTNGILSITNEGTGELNITSITSSDAKFESTTSALTIAPGETEDVTILFSPDATGSFTADLTIESNDADTPSLVIPLAGEAVAAPIISVTPLAITENLSTAEAASNTVTVGNSGDGELEWTVDVYAIAVEPTGTFFEKENYADETLEANQDRITSEVWITRTNNDGVFNAFEESSYSGSTTTIEWAEGPTSEASPDDYTSFKDALDNNVGNNVLTTTLSLHLIAEDRYFDVEFSFWQRNQDGGGFAYTRKEVFQWLNVDETIVEGDLNLTAAAASTMFDLEIDGSQLFEGDFTGTATITSNDPLEPEQVITVNVSVTGTPDISTTETTAVTSIESGASTVVEIPVVNSGDGVLNVSNVASDNGVLVPSATSFSVPPFSTYILETTFSPTAVQIYDIDLTITSDDPVAPSLVIDVTAEGLAVPAFDITETTFSATLEAGNTSTATFTISNTGAGTLNWDVGEVYFTKENNADFTQAENQDRIKEDVWITRREYEPIFNYFETTDYNRNSETIMYGDGQTSSLPFSAYDSDFQEATGYCGSCLPGNTLSLYLVDYDEFYDLDVSFWQDNEGGGGFSYVRRLASPWLSLDTYSASLGLEGASVVEITFDASNVNAGTYTFSYDILTNDPANPSTTVTFNLEVTGTPSLSISEGSDFDFDDQFVGEIGTDGMLEIRNTGTATLNVSDIQFDDPVFSATTTTASVEPGEFATFELTFSPTALEEYSATGTITSNEDGGTQTFTVNGTSIPVPDISLDIASVDVELLSGGLVERTFTVTNNGSSTANWNIEDVKVTGTDAILFVKENFADWTQAENQDRVSENLWITRDEIRGIFNAALETSYTNGDGGERDLRIGIPIEGPIFELDPYDASPHGTLWSNGPAYDGINLTTWRSASSGVSDLPGETLTMWDVEDDKYYTIDFLTWTSGEGERSNPKGGGFSYLRSETATWINNFSSTQGVLEPGGDGDEVTFYVDAEGVSAGDYEATIVISDGLNTQEIDVTLTVLGLPEISVGVETLDFESVFVGDESTQTFDIANDGLADLEISSIVSDDAAFTVVSAPSTIGIDGVETVEIVFSPTESVSYSGTLTITSNDGVSSTLTIGLSGSGQNPPVLSVDKTSLDQTLFFGASASQTFTITNDGDADLEWQLGLSGGTVSFTKEDWADWTLPENQDRITDNIWITRADSRGLFNVAQEDEFERSISPVGTLWDRGATGGESNEGGEGPCCFVERAVDVKIDSYGSWNNNVGGNPSSDQVYSMFIEETGAFYDVVFTEWTQGNDDGVPPGGGFSYERTPVFVNDYEAISFSAIDGVVAPGESQDVTVFFNPTGTFDGNFELPLQVESNDPSGPAEIPLTLNVNGIIVENPIEDQLVNEGFTTSTFDISNMFADAQDDPLTYAINSSDGNVASAVESGGILTVTEVGIGTTTISITAEDGKGSSDTFEFDFRVNAFPVSETSIPDQTEDVGFGTITLDVATAFSDPDGDDLTFSATSDNDGVVTVSMAGSILTITEVAAGNTVVNVTADDGFGAQLTAFVLVTVNKLAQTITFDALATVSEDVGTVSLTATASSGLTVTYESSNASVATVSGSTLTIVGDGQTTITASQAGDAEFASATPVSQTLTVDAVLSASDLENVEFYPNPVQNFLTIRDTNVTVIEIYHLDGKLVMSQEVSEKADLTSLDGGIYLVKLKDVNDTELYSGRLVKN